MTLDPLLIDLPMPIVTPRLTIQPIQPGDGAAVHAAKMESWDDLARWSIWTFKPKNDTTEQDDELLCHRFHRQFVSREKIPLLAFNRKDGVLVGQGSLSNCDWTNRIFCLGYWVRTGCAGQGFATEIGSALCTYAFREMKAFRLTSFHAEGNDASRRVLEKLGFEQEGIFRNHHFLGTQAVNEYHYGLLDPARLPDVQTSWDGNATPVRPA